MSKMVICMMAVLNTLLSEPAVADMQRRAILLIAYEKAHITVAQYFVNIALQRSVFCMCLWI